MLTEKLRQQIKESNLTKGNLKVILLDNFVDKEGDLDLIGLDFSDFDGDIYIGYMKVKGNLEQSYQKVKGNLYQDCQEVGGNLLQECQKVQGELRKYTFIQKQNKKG